MKNLILYGGAIALLTSTAFADQESVVTVSKDVPMAVNSVSSGETVVGAPASGTVTRSGRSTMTVNLINSCFPTNLRAVTNPLAKSSLVSAEINLSVGGVTYNLFAEYPAVVATKDGTGAIGNVQPVSTSKGKITPSGGSVAIYGNVVQFKTNIPTGVTIDSNANITVSKAPVAMGDTSFEQAIQDCKTGPVWGDYGWSAQIPTYGCGNFMGKDGPVSASFNGFNVSPDRSTVEIYISFPGETGFCGGFWSPLMVFFDDKLPTFDNVSEFPLNPGGKVHWPEAGSPGYFVAMDVDRNGKIDKKNELFGDGEGNQNGFEALKKLDTNHDGVIDSKDKDFNRLVLWNDKNGDGISQKSEMVKASAKLTKISLKYEQNVMTINQNAEIRQVGKFWYKDDKGKSKTGKIYDIWFAPHIDPKLAAK